jgi:hypothetical protein
VLSQGDEEESMDGLYGLGSDDDEEDEEGGGETEATRRARKRMEAMDDYEDSGDSGDEDLDDDEDLDGDEDEGEDDEDEDGEDEDEDEGLDDSDDEDGEGPGAGDETAEFMAAKAFAGARAGYVFKSGDLGVGYYRDGSADRTSKPRKKGAKTHWGVESDGEEGGIASASRGGVDGLADSVHAKATRKLSAKLSALEEAQVAEKPWQLAGEVSSSRRPVNSLLEAELDFDAATKLAPVITEEVRLQTPFHTLRSRSVAAMHAPCMNDPEER